MTKSSHNNRLILVFIIYYVIVCSHCLVLILFMKRWSEQRQSSLDVVRLCAGQTCSPFVIMRQGTETSKNTGCKNWNKAWFSPYLLVGSNIMTTHILIYDFCFAILEETQMRGLTCEEGYATTAQLDIPATQMVFALYHVDHIF